MDVGAGSGDARPKRVRRWTDPDPRRSPNRTESRCQHASPGLRSGRSRARGVSRRTRESSGRRTPGGRIDPTGVPHGSYRVIRDRPVDVHAVATGRVYVTRTTGSGGPPVEGPRPHHTRTTYRETCMTTIESGRDRRAGRDVVFPGVWRDGSDTSYRPAHSMDRRQLSPTVRDRHSFPDVGNYFYWTRQTTVGGATHRCGRSSDRGRGRRPRVDLEVTPRRGSIPAPSVRPRLSDLVDEVSKRTTGRTGRGDEPADPRRRVRVETRSDRRGRDGCEPGRTSRCSTLRRRPGRPPELDTDHDDRERRRRVERACARYGHMGVNPSPHVGEAVAGPRPTCVDGLRRSREVARVRLMERLS